MAKAPTFRLATLERLREKEVDSRVQALHRARTELREAMDLLDTLRERLQASSPAGPTSAEELMAGAQYRERLRDQIRSGEVHTARLEQVLEQARQAWLQAKAQLKAVAGLHDRFREARRAEIARSEQREIDELAGSPRRRGSGR
jgi:flagellar export protein FliJ